MFCITPRTSTLSITPSGGGLRLHEDKTFVLLHEADKSRIKENMVRIFTFLIVFIYFIFLVNIILFEYV